jgi:hypothetical protein
VGGFKKTQQRTADQQTLMPLGEAARGAHRGPRKKHGGIQKINWQPVGQETEHDGAHRERPAESEFEVAVLGLA